MVLQRSFRLTGWTVNQLWCAAISVGGRLDRRDIERITTGSRPATPTEHDVLAAALNDYFVDQDEDHPVALWNDLITSR